MPPQTLARVAAPVSLFFGAIGLLVPDLLAAAFGIQLDAAGAVLARLTCASYFGLGVLNWLARDVTDGPAWRAIIVGNGVGWGISAVPVALAILSGLGTAAAWVIVALQVAFTVAWGLAYARAPAGAAEVLPSAAGGEAR